MNIPESPRILRLSGVREKTGKSTSAIYADMAKGMFPRPVPLGDRAVGWLEHEVGAWIEAQRAKRDATAAASVKHHQFMNFVSTKKPGRARARTGQEVFFRKSSDVSDSTAAPWPQYLST